MITNLRERRDRIIEEIITTFMETGKAVSSSFVSATCGLGLGPATIRSMMKELESDGYLSHPHTSAGCVPTVKCYRYYVKYLMPEISLPGSDLEKVRRLAEDIVREHDADVFMNHVASVLSEVTDLIGVVMAPSFEKGIFDKIEIINLGGSRFLFIITLKSGIVNTLHLTVDHITPRLKINETARLLTERLHGLTIAEIKISIGQRLKGVTGGDRKLVEVVLASSNQIFNFPEANNVHLSGLSRALAHPDFGPVDYSLKLVDMFEQKSEIVKALEMSFMDENDVSILIGGSGPWGSQPPLCLVSAMYQTGNAAGVIGIIGPARVHYPKLTAIVRYTVPITSHFFSL